MLQLLLLKSTVHYRIRNQQKAVIRITNIGIDIALVKLATNGKSEWLVSGATCSFLYLPLNGTPERNWHQ